MILNGNPRGSANDMADHLLKAENEIVEIYDLRGFVSRDLHGAFNEIYALSRATKCDQFLYSLSLNPPPNAAVSDEDFLAAIERAEKKLGLSGQARAIVFHEKHGRRHCHVVWSRIDPETMTARNIAFDKEKLTNLSRELFREYGWEMPRGLQERGQRDPTNYTHAEYQQTKRVAKHAGEIKADIQAAWAASDTKAAFEHALIERGYMLARGDKRGFVIVDAQGEIYSLPRLLGIKTKAVRERLGDPAALPSIEAVLEKVTALAQTQESQRKELTPQEACNLIAYHHAAFSRKMMERALKRHIPALQKRREMIDELLASDHVIKLGEKDGQTFYAAAEMIALEKRMVETADALAKNLPSLPNRQAVQQAIFAMNAKLGKETDGKAALSQEQIAAIKHMTSGHALSLVVGVAGAGKTTIMEAAKDALEAQGYRVRGAAPSGIAAAGLKDIGLQASTLHALEARLNIADDILRSNQGRPLTPKQQAVVKSAMLTKHDVILVDEAGMVGARQMENILRRVHEAGAKIILVGDPEQLQSVEAGTAFKTLLDRHRSARLTEVRRQKTEWQRDASLLFADGKTEDALVAYQKHRQIVQVKEHDDAIKTMVADYMQSFHENPDASRLALAYTRADVAALNTAIRAEMIELGKVAEKSAELTVTLKDGDSEIKSKQRFAAGDRILFRENNADLGVMNGSFGTVEAASDLCMTVKLDNGKAVTFGSATLLRTVPIQGR